MKLKKTLLAVLSACIISTAAFAVDTAAVSNGLNDFATQLLTAVPEASTQQNVWADAYIGKVFPSFPPHLGGGFTIGGSQLDMTGLKSAADALTDSFNSVTETTNVFTSFLNGSTIPSLDFGSIPDSFFMPTMSLDLRVGGLFLPFDVGLCAMMTNPSLFGVDLKDPSSILDSHGAMNFSWAGYNGTFDYITIGADIRYAVLEESLVVPAVSVGLGYMYTKGSFGISTDSSTDVPKLGTLTTTANMDISFQSQVLFLQAEVSKNFAIVSVYGGLRGILSNSTNSWAWKYSTTSSEQTSLSVADSDEGTVASGKDPSSVYTDGKWDFSGIQPQIYAGVGFNFLCFQTTVGACVDVASFFREEGKYQWSGLLSFRAKI